jgi:hypothetical protein
LDPNPEPDPSPVSDPNPDPLARGTDPWDPNPESDPNPDPLARGTDPQIRIRTKMSRIRNTALNVTSFGIRPLKFVV